MSLSQNYGATLTELELKCVTEINSSEILTPES